jgi:hypothetical protein
MDYFVKEVINPTSNFTWQKGAFLSIEWYQGYWVLLEWVVNFEDTRNSCCFGALCSVHRRIKRRNASTIIWFTIYRCHHASYKIWRWVIHLGFERHGNSLPKFEVRNHKVSKKSKTIFKHRHTPLLQNILVDQVIYTGLYQSFKKERWRFHTDGFNETLLTGWD